jgi:hypothetical protein
MPLAHRGPLQFVTKVAQVVFHFQGFVYSIPEFSAPSFGVTECHADDGRRIADSYLVAIERLKINSANDRYEHCYSFYRRR